MKKVKSLVVIAVCLLSLSIGLVFATNTISVAHASSEQGGFNEEYDIQYADIMDRYEQNLITYDEAMTEYLTLSQSGAVLQAESTQGDGGIMPLAATGTRSGNVSYIPTSGAAAVPLRRVKVVLYNGLPGPGLEEIASTYSDYNGNWSITYDLPLFGWFGDYQNLSIAVYAESETFRVARDWTAITPLLEYSVFAWFESDVNQGDHFNLIYSFENNDRHKAFCVSQGMSWAQRYAKEVGGMSTNKKLKVVYGSHVNVTSFCWNTFSAIGAGDSDSLDTLLHEYGHFVSGAMGNLPISLWDVIVNAKDFTHSGTEDHFIGKDKQFALDLAWMESWATAFALMAYNQYSGTYGTNPGMTNVATRFGAYNAQISTFGPNSGEAQERAVISLLWDLFGARNTNLMADSWTPLGHAAFWQRTMSAGTTTLINFSNNMSSSYPQFRNQIGTRMGFFKIAPQALTITNTPNAGTAPSFSWRVNGSQNNPNNQFRIVFYNMSGVDQLETGNLTVTYTADPANPTRNDLRIATATLSQVQWEGALTRFSNGETAQVAVKGFLNNSPISGPYWSATIQISMDYARLTYTTVSGGLSVTGVNFIPSNGMVDIPATYNEQAVVAIAANAFSGQTQLSQITIPASVREINPGAFQGCVNLQTVTFAGTPQLQTISNSAFYNCTSLFQISIPSSVTSIKQNAFLNSGIWNNTANNSIVYAGNWTVGYKGTLNASITLNSNTRGISDSAFANQTGLTGANLLNSLTIIGNHAFYSCSNLKSITLSSNLTSIGDHAFRQCTKLTAIELPNTLISIGDLAFEYCESLKSITIPLSVTTIGYEAFSGCSNLTIYAKAVTKPNGWSATWNLSNRPVVWAHDGQMWQVVPNGQLVAGRPTRVSLDFWITTASSYGDDSSMDLYRIIVEFTNSTTINGGTLGLIQATVSNNGYITLSWTNYYDSSYSAYLDFWEITYGTYIEQYF